MLYTIIRYVTTAIFFILGRHTVHGAYIEPNITVDHDIHCGDSYNDVCRINCTFTFNQDPWTTAKIPNVYCGNTTQCIIRCTGDFCLRNTIIHAKHTKHIDIVSQHNSCLQSAQLHLPNHGNATIIGHTDGLYNNTLHGLQIYSGTDTNKINITCTDSTYYDVHNDCDNVQVHAQTAKYLTITIHGSSFRNSTIYCPESSALSPSCVIDADRAQSTENLQIYAIKGMPHDVIFHSNHIGNISSIYTGTTITCFDGDYSSVIYNDNFIGTPCFFTSEPTTEPTIEPTYTEYIFATESTTQNDGDENPTKGIIKSILDAISLELLLLILCGLTTLAGCCIIILYVLNKRKQKNLDQKQMSRLYSTEPEKIIAANNEAKGLQNGLAQAPNPMANVIAEFRLNSNDVIDITAGGDMVPPAQQMMEHNVSNVTRLPPPVPRNKSKPLQSVELAQNVERDTKGKWNGEEKGSDSDSDDDEGGDAVVNIVVSSMADAKHHNVGSKSELEPVQKQVDDLKDADSWSRSTENNEENLVTKGGTTKGDVSDSDSSFSTDSVKGGLTDIGDLVIGGGGGQEDIGEADDEDLLVGEVGSF